MGWARSKPARAARTWPSRGAQKCSSKSWRTASLQYERTSSQERRPAVLQVARQVDGPAAAGGGLLLGVLQGRLGPRDGDLLLGAVAAAAGASGVAPQCQVALGTQELLFALLDLAAPVGGLPLQPV